MIIASLGMTASPDIGVAIMPKEMAEEGTEPDEEQANDETKGVDHHKPGLITASY